MRRLRVALLGYGVAGKFFHAPFLSTLPFYELSGIFVRNPVNAGLPADIRVYKSLQEIIEDKVDAVVIATPPPTHYPLAKQFIEAGIHLVVDKPFMCSSKEAEEISTLATKKGVLVSVFHNRRYDSGFRTLKNLIQDDTLGEVVEYTSRFDRWRPDVMPGKWKEQEQAGSGLLFDLGSHLIDQALFLFGMPRAISGVVRKLNPAREVDDYFALHLHYENREVTLHGSSFVASPFPHFEVHGTTGSYVKHGLDPQEEKLRAGEIFSESDKEWGRENESSDGVLYQLARGLREEIKITTLPGSYALYYKEFFNAVMGRGELPVSAEDGLKVISLIELAKKSVREERRVTL